MSDPQQYPHTERKLRQQKKREGANGHPGKAGRLEGKGGAATSHRATGGKRAR